LKPPNTPSNEPARLRALAEYDVLDSPPEAEFDTLTRLAAELLGVPIALVSLVDSDRQWFKSRYGLDAPETSREVSFCGHVVEAESPLVVADTLADDRFSDNPLVTGNPRIRFYAGQPLRTSDGFVLGTLCAIDTKPRELSDAQRETLGMLARQVVALLELRRKTRELTEERATLELHRRFFDLSGELFCVADADLRLLAVNPAWQRTLGWSLDEVRARASLDLLHPDDLPKTRAELAKLRHEGHETIAFDNRYRHKDGRWLTLAWVASLADGMLVASARDITAKREKESALRAREAELEQSEGRLRALFDGMVEGVVVQNDNGAILDCNPAAEKILGLTLSQLQGVTSTDPRWRAIRDDGSGFPGAEHPAMESLRTGQGLTDVVMGVSKPDGLLTWISINARPLFLSGDTRPYAVITTFRDISEQRAAANTKERLARQERLVTTGTLAAGVGHEINNPLTYVITNLDFSLEELRSIAGGSPSARLNELIEVLSEAREGADRVRKIVRGLRALAREDGPLVPTVLGPLIEISINMAMHEIRQKATLHSALEVIPPVLADESRLTQVLVNLLVNAAQAFPVGDVAHNRIEVRTAVVPQGVEISVSDNGPGIPPDVLPRIYDPFFTTKQVGEGTGLGLSISHSIVTSLGGSISCQTSVPGGTTFTVVLPVATDAVARVGVEDSASRGRVLLIDDEVWILRSLARLLDADHDVVAVSDPREAWGLLADGGHFDVVFCDLMMPAMSGVELYRRVREINPALADRFVFLSGAITRPELAMFLEAVPNERIEKPYSVQNIRSIVKRFVIARTREIG
jgi:PAS domain S-box-containing protein